MLDVIIGRHTWNCQIRTHIHAYEDAHTHTDTHTHNKKKVGKVGEKRKEGKKEGGFREERHKSKGKDKQF